MLVLRNFCSLMAFNCSARLSGSSMNVVYIPSLMGALERKGFTVPADAKAKLFQFEKSLVATRKASKHLRSRTLPFTTFDFVYMFVEAVPDGVSDKWEIALMMLLGLLGGNRNSAIRNLTGADFKNMQEDQHGHCAWAVEFTQVKNGEEPHRNGGTGSKYFGDGMNLPYYLGRFCQVRLDDPTASWLDITKTAKLFPKSSSQYNARLAAYSTYCSYPRPFTLHSVRCVATCLTVCWLYQTSWLDVFAGWDDLV